MLSQVEKERYFADYDAYHDSEIVSVDKKGITLSGGTVTNFAECALNFKKINADSGGICVGERDVTDCSFVFYALPKPVMIKFFDGKGLRGLFGNETAVKKFHALQAKINAYGCATFDQT